MDVMAGNDMKRERLAAGRIGAIVMLCSHLLSLLVVDAGCGQGSARESGTEKVGDFRGVAIAGGSSSGGTGSKATRAKREVDAAAAPCGCAAGDPLCTCL
jgi:hypothetical protein